MDKRDGEEGLRRRVEEDGDGGYGLEDTEGPMKGGIHEWVRASRA